MQTSDHRYFLYYQMHVAELSHLKMHREARQTVENKEMRIAADCEEQHMQHFRLEQISGTIQTNKKDVAINVAMAKAIKKANGLVSQQQIQLSGPVFDIKMVISHLASGRTATSQPRIRPIGPDVSQILPLPLPPRPPIHLLTQPVAPAEALVYFTAGNQPGPSEGSKNRAFKRRYGNRFGIGSGIQ